jgi:hypothetical protein
MPALAICIKDIFLGKSRILARALGIFSAWVVEIFAVGKKFNNIY